jgi:hypothetical protein
MPNCTINDHSLDLDEYRTWLEASDEDVAGPLPCRLRELIPIRPVAHLGEMSIRRVIDFVGAAISSDNSSWSLDEIINVTEVDICEELRNILSTLNRRMVGSVARERLHGETHGGQDLGGLFDDDHGELDDFDDFDDRDGHASLESLPDGGSDINDDMEDAEEFFGIVTLDGTSTTTSSLEERFEFASKVKYLLDSTDKSYRSAGQTTICLTCRADPLLSDTDMPFLDDDHVHEHVFHYHPDAVNEVLLEQEQMYMGPRRSFWLACKADPTISDTTSRVSDDMMELHLENIWLPVYRIMDCDHVVVLPTRSKPYLRLIQMWFVVRCYAVAVWKTRICRRIEGLN